MSTPRVSVILPVFNAESFVDAAVRSIREQTFADFEVIAIDDGSTDGSRGILERHAREDRRIRVISRENRGLVATLNEGLQLATAPLICRMDADDISLPDRLAVQTEFFERHPEVVCAGAHYEKIDEKDRLLIVFDQMPTDDAVVQQRLLGGDTVLCHPTVVMRRDAVLRAGGYDPGDFPAEDLALFIRLGEIGKLAVVPHIVLRYREHAGSVSAKKHGVQVAKMREVCDRACARRGVAVEFINTGWRPTSRGEEHRFLVKYGWWGFNRGDRPMAVDYALRAIRHSPFAPAGWRLLACAVLKPARKREAGSDAAAPGASNRSRDARSTGVPAP